MPSFINPFFNAGEKTGKAVYDVHDIANIILRKLYDYSKIDPSFLPTNMKLLKLLYFVQGFYIKYNDVKLFDGCFQAWVNGPVIPSIFQRFKYYGTSVIREDEIGRLIKIGDHCNNLINSVIKEYGKKPPYELSRLTHEDGTAWKKTRIKNNLSEYQSSQCVIPYEFISEEFEGKDLEGYLGKFLQKLRDRKIQ